MKVALVLALSWCGSVLGRSVADPDERPNLIVLVTDDQPFDAMSCAGNTILRTPHMDRLAAQGARYTHAFATTPICAASRASIFTGRYERSHGYTFGQPPLADEVVQQSYPALLRGAGYRVGLVGKLGVSLTSEARAEMFDEYQPGTYPYFRDPADGEPSDVSKRHLTEINTDRAIEFLSVRDERPFCLSLSFQAPHAEDDNPDQYVWPTSCDELYRSAEIPAPAAADPAFFEALPEFLRTGLNRERWHWRFDTPAKRTAMVRGYYRMLTGVDEAVGRLRAALAELELQDDTVILLIGDNGYFLGERGYAGKWTMHDRSTRVPLIVFDPRREPEQRGRTVESFALNLDIAPTLLDLAGVAIPAEMQGSSLASPESPAERTEVFTEHLWDFARIPRTEALRTRDWKYIRYLDHPEFEELYDLRDDPDEEHNLARSESYAERLRELRERCSVAAQRAER